MPNRRLNNSAYKYQDITGSTVTWKKVCILLDSQMYSCAVYMHLFYFYRYIWRFTL